jgi:hypothetical protein
MQELIDKLKTEVGLTDEQAIKSLQVIKDYITSKLPPMMQGMVDNFLGSSASDDFMDKH